MMKALLFLVSCVFLLAAAQNNCPNCANGCPSPMQGANCVNGEWVFGQNTNFAGNLNFFCPSRVQGNANFAGNTVLNFNYCGRLNVNSAFITAQSGVGITLDMMGNSAAAGTKFVFATFQRSQGYVSSVNVQGIAVGEQAPGLNPRLGNGEGAVHFRATGDHDMNTGNGEPVVAGNGGNAFNDPNFDANGNRVNKCAQLTCRNPNLCTRPTPEATCDIQTGEWVLPASFDLRSADISCPLRIRGDLRVTESLTLRGCGRVAVTGTATLGNNNNGNIVPALHGINVVFDLDDTGALSPGTTMWFTAGRIVGGLRQWEFRNIWDTSGRRVSPTNQLCNNQMSIIYVPQGQPSPRDTCPGHVNVPVNNNNNNVNNNLNNGNFNNNNVNNNFPINNNVNNNNNLPINNVNNNVNNFPNNNVNNMPNNNNNNNFPNNNVNNFPNNNVNNMPNNNVNNNFPNNNANNNVNNNINNINNNFGNADGNNDIGNDNDNAMADDTNDLALFDDINAFAVDGDEAAAAALFETDEAGDFALESDEAAAAAALFEGEGDFAFDTEDVAAMIDDGEIALDTDEAAAAFFENGDDLVAANAPTDSTNTASSTSSTAPTYAYVLFALSVVVLTALVVVQVLIIKVKRAQDDIRM